MAAAGGRAGGAGFDRPRRYAIRVEGALDPARWSAWFDGMALRCEAFPGRVGGGAGAADAVETVIEGEVADQCALHGLLIKVRDLHLTLVSVQRL
jgi:hypothetical protein